LNKNKKILVVPLDWGLGHATRCMPLIAEFLQQKCEVVVAGTETTNELIRQAFPLLQYVVIDGYEVAYSHSKWQLPFVIAKQIPKILAKIKAENKWLRQFVANNEIDIVISDNRYGLHHPTVKTIFMSHQLQIQVPQSSWIQWIVNKINHSYINRFSVCWVPDYKINAIGGELSNNKGVRHVEYIGNLSRFDKQDPTEINNDILFLISGPEPQRSLLERKIILEFTANDSRKIIVRGLPKTSEILEVNGFEIYNHLSKKELQDKILCSKTIVCRAGYSTIMDLIKLNKNALLIPTPGQTEQEYLAKQLSKRKLYFSINQRQNILESVALFKEMKFEKMPDYDLELYKEKVKKIIG
jgi:uncharacterized protein (TIGR00661 family)